MPADRNAPTSPMRGTAQMFRCPVCDATGKIGTTLGFGGSTCNFCQGRCYLSREPTVCPSCDGKGGKTTMLGLRWNVCRLCHGVKYLMEKPFPCPKCKATGLVKGFGGLFSTPCNLCDRQRFLRQPHGRCIKCNFTSSFVRYFRPCINCGGIGYSQEPQHLCPRCNSTGTFKGNSCMLCGGCGVIHHDVVACVKCGGAGEIKRTLSFFLGKSTCPTCNGQGYFQTFSTITGPVQPKSERKRVRDSNGEASEGSLVPRNEDELDKADAGVRAAGGTATQTGGGSEPRRRVKGKRTPAEEARRRQTISTLDLDRPPQPDFSPVTRTPAPGRAAANGPAGVSSNPAGGSTVGRGGDAGPRDVEDGFGGRFDFGPSSSGAAGAGSIYSPVMGDGESIIEGSAGKRRRHR